MKFQSQLQKQFAKVGRIFPKPTFKATSQINASLHNVERERKSQLA